MPAAVRGSGLTGRLCISGVVLLSVLFADCVSCFAGKEGEGCSAAAFDCCALRQRHSNNAAAAALSSSKAVSDSRVHVGRRFG